MTDDPRLQQLLDELLDSHATPEEVCRSCPELLPEVRARWRRMRRLQDELDAMFPTPPEPGEGSPPLPLEGTALPQVPGYEVEGVLGRGGMGVVFRARHLSLDRVVALKMALAGAYAGPAERERFRREAEAVARLRHPNVVHVYDVGEADGRPYFTMEFVEGGSLAQQLAGTPQPARQAAALLAALAAGVQAAHAAGIVHRDLKPGNVLLTTDGTPKVTDFGLARRLDSETGLTRTGALVGTPAYVAPEQARGKAAAVGPAADVYALGAILYELLTGRPPFRGETATETVLQVLHQDPVPPARLNARVPRDLETVCLKCLHKQPERRYASAGALAEDLDRFLQGEAIAARPEGWLERWARWLRRRPALLVGLTGGLLLAAALVGGGLSLRAERAAADRAKALLDQLDRDSRDQKFVARLDSIHLNRSTGVDGRHDRRLARRRADQDYATAFREGGFGEVHDDPGSVAARVTASNVHESLVGALDDWAVCAAYADDPGRQGWLLEVARRADPDPTGLRNRLRDPAAARDPEALGRWAAEAKPSVQLLVTLAERLQDAGADAVPFLRQVQHDHPNDFFANLRLGDALLAKQPGEAIRYYQAALAVRPGSAVVHDVLGIALAKTRRLDEAIDHFREALGIEPEFANAHANLARALLFKGLADEGIDHYREALRIDPDDVYARVGLAGILSQHGRQDEGIDQFREALRINPEFAPAHSGLGIVLLTTGQLDKAADHLRQTLRIDPTQASAHYYLGQALLAGGQLDEATDHYREAVRLDPTDRAAADILRGLLVRRGRGEEARAGWQEALEANPSDPDGWDGYAALCLFLGQEDEYRRARRAMLGLFGNSTEPIAAGRLALACLLLPAAEDDLRAAAALADRAVAAGDPVPDGFAASFRFARALAAYRQGRLKDAIAGLDGDVFKVLPPAPGLLLAMAQYRQGRKGRARQTLAAAVLAFDWSSDRAEAVEAWTIHVLRREAEGLILPDLPAFLEGKYQPRDNDERLALLGVCQFQDRTRAAAGLYAEAFAADPALAENLRAGHRYHAAAAAARAGCGRGADAAGLEEAEAMRWREQARRWLRADLAAWGRALDGDPAGTRDRARKALTQWREDAALAGLRDPDALDRLPAQERQDCLALWEEVGRVLGRATEPK
jgi:serine/threonine-protein kinase